MRVEVTQHAIKRYRERLFDQSSPDKVVIRILGDIADKGRIIRHRLDNRNTCLEIKYKGVSIVVVEEPGKRIVITCLGEACYRRWIKTKGMREKSSQRILLTHSFEWHQGKSRCNSVKCL